MSSSEEEKLLQETGASSTRNTAKTQSEWLYHVLDFSSDRSLALLHVLYSSSGELYLLERKDGKWRVKFNVQTMAT